MKVTDTQPSKREQTRAKVIAAAISCIYDDGFNTANTNRICERAGVSWGVLQYHFADKDGLLQAVLDHIFSDFSHRLQQADVRCGSLRQRITLLIDLIWSLVSRPEYRVSIAILRNAGSSTINGEALLRHWSQEVSALWQQLFDDLIDTPARSEAAKRLMFATLRGLADDLNPEGSNTRQQLQQEFSALRDALLFLLCQ